MKLLRFWPPFAVLCLLSQLAHLTPFRFEAHHLLGWQWIHDPVRVFNGLEKDIWRHSCFR